MILIKGTAKAQKAAIDLAALLAKRGASDKKRMYQGFS
jgi:hypothetical protein